MEINYKNLFISAVCVTALAGLGYAIYFDYKRRNDSSFRKELKKKKQQKTSENELNKTLEGSTAEAANKLATIYTKVKDEPKVPFAAYEGFLLEQLSKGEMLLNQGPEHYEAAALEFFRAIINCPNPIDLVFMLEKLIPKPVYELLLALTHLELETRQRGFLEYYRKYPTPDKNVKLVEDRAQPTVKNVKSFFATATKDFEVGDVIYTEKPLTSTLVPSLEGKSFCSVCLKSLTEPIKHPYLENVYCSQACYKAVALEFPSERPTKGSLDLLSHYKESGKMLPSMLGRLYFKALHQYFDKEVTSFEPENYTAMQHAEYLASPEQALDSNSFKTDLKLIHRYLKYQLEVVDQVITGDIIKDALGKYSRASLAIVTAPEDADVIACPKTDEGIRYVVPGPYTGCGYYPLSAYVKSGLDEANCQAEFKNQDYELSLVAIKPIKKGDVLSLLTFDASTAKPKATKATVDSVGTDYPSLVSEGSTELLGALKPLNVATEPSYAKVVSEPPELGSSQTPSKASDAPSYAQVTRDSVVEPKDEKAEAPEGLSEAELAQAPSYAAIAAEPPAKDSDVLYPEEITSSQEFEKVEASESP